MMREITGNRDRNKYSFAADIAGTGYSCSRREICMLANNVDYFLHHAYILREKVGYRLVVIHAGLVRTNKCYAELRHAKIAFARIYNKKSWKKGVKAEWSHLYKPDMKWWDKKINIFIQTESP